MYDKTKQWTDMLRFETLFEALMLRYVLNFPWIPKHFVQYVLFGRYFSDSSIYQAVFRAIKYNHDVTDSDNF